MTLSHDLDLQIRITRRAYRDALRSMHACTLPEPRRWAAQLATQHALDLLRLLNAARLHHLYTSCAERAYALGDQDAVRTFTMKAAEVYGDVVGAGGMVQ